MTNNHSAHHFQLHHRRKTYFSTEQNHHIAVHHLTQDHTHKQAQAPAQHHRRSNASLDRGLLSLSVTTLNTTRRHTLILFSWHGTCKKTDACNKMDPSFFGKPFRIEPIELPAVQRLAETYSPWSCQRFPGMDEHMACETQNASQIKADLFRSWRPRWRASPASTRVSCPCIGQTRI